MQYATTKTIALLYPIPVPTSIVEFEIFSRKFRWFNRNRPALVTQNNVRQFGML